MKILYGVTKSNFGGAQRYVFELAQYAQSEQYEVFVTCGGHGVLVDKLSAIQIPVFPLESIQRDISLIKEIKSLFNLFKIVRTIRPDIVHFNSPKLGGLGSVVARLAGVKKIVYTNHGWPFKEDRPFWQLILIKFFSFLTIIFCHNIIVLSETELDMIRHWPYVRRIIGTKCTVIPNGVQTFTPYDRDSALAHLVGVARAEEIRAEAPVILGNISELHPNKGYLYALQGLHTYLYSMRKESDPLVHFIIVSEGQERDSLKALVQHLALERFVTFAGYIQDARIYTPAFDVFLMTSIKEGLPFALLEAGFARVPIITTTVGGIPELITHQHTGILIEPKNQTAIAEAIYHAVHHLPELNAYAQRFKHIINTSYNFSTLAPRILVLYK